MVWVAPLIAAAASMMQGLMSAEDQRKKEGLARKEKAIEKGYGGMIEAAQNYPVTQQNAFNSIMQSYGRALGQ